MEFFLAFNVASNCWVRNIVTEVFSGPVVTGYYAKFSTVQDTAGINPKAVVTGGNRYTFQIRGEGWLLQRLYARYARHSFDFTGVGMSANAFVDCFSEDAYVDSDTHNQFAYGSLWDNVRDTRFSFANRNGLPSSVNGMIWNSVSYDDAVDIEGPRSQAYYNWGVGNIGRPNGHYRPAPGNTRGVVVANGTSVAPRSILVQQMVEVRLSSTQRSALRVV